MNIRKGMPVQGTLIIILVLVYFFFPQTSCSAQETGKDILDSFTQKTYPPDDLLPHNVVTMDRFAPGKEKKVGVYTRVKGRVFVVHHGEASAWKPRQGHGIFAKDLIISLSGANAQATIGQETAIFLSENSKMEITPDLYQPSASGGGIKAELSLLFGKIRIVVNKLIRGKEKRFTTPTSVLGIRGSDFVIYVAPASIGIQNAPPEDLATLLLTGEDTHVYFSGKTGPEQMIGPNSISLALEGMAATAAISLSPSIVNEVFQQMGGDSLVRLQSASGPPGPSFTHLAAGAGAAIAVGAGIAYAVSEEDENGDSSQDLSPGNISGFWVYMKCANQAEDMAVFHVSADESGGFYEIGQGTDYDGNLVRVIIQGQYEKDSGRIHGEVNSISQATVPRTDVFETTLSRDTGYLYMDRTVGKGCENMIRFRLE